jgi:hypothetical protein
MRDDGCSSTRLAGTRSLLAALITLSLIVTMLHFDVRAETPVDSVCPGLTIATPSEFLPIRKAPRERFLWFYGPGTKVGTLRPGEKVTIQKTDIVSTAFGEQKWAQIQADGTEGWLYIGKPGDSDSQIEKEPGSKCKQGAK